MDLPADERETLAEFEQKLLQVGDQTLLQVPFTADFGLADEVKQVRVTGGLEVGIPGRQGRGELLIAVPVRSCSRVAM